MNNHDLALGDTFNKRHRSALGTLSLTHKGLKIYVLFQPCTPNHRLSPPPENGFEPDQIFATHRLSVQVGALSSHVELPI